MKASGSIDAGIVTVQSPYPFSETVQRLISAFTHHQVRVFATIDQQAEALACGLVMPPTTLIVFGSPKAGTPLMLAQPTSGIDLPLKVLVWEATAGKVLVHFNSAAYIIDRHALPLALVANLLPPERLIRGALTAGT